MLGDRRGLGPRGVVVCPARSRGGQSEGRSGQAAHVGSDGLAIKTNALFWADLTQAAEETLAAWTS